MLGKKHLALGIFLLGGATTVILSRPPHPRGTSSEAAMPQRDKMAKIEEAISRDHTRREGSADAPSPMRHEEALEMLDALKDFDASFKAAVESHRQDFATRLMLRKLTREPQGIPIYDWLMHYMNQHEFLWQDPQLLLLYWSSCVSARCDQAEFKMRLGQKNPSFFAKENACLDSWAGLMSLVTKAQAVTAEDVQLFRPELQRCLASPGEIDEARTTQLQYFLGLVQMRFTRDKAEAEYHALQNSFPFLPDLKDLLPAS